MSKTATSLNTRRYWKHIEGAKKARVSERKAQQACSEELREAYRDLDDGELLAHRCAEVGCKYSVGHQAKYAVLKADTGFHADTIRRALALEVIVETIPASAPPGAEPKIGPKAADRITSGLPMEGLLAGKYKAEVTKRVNKALQVAAENGREKITEADARAVVPPKLPPNVKNLDSYSKQADDLSVALGIVHALEQINETAAKMTAFRAVQVIQSHDGTSDDFTKEWADAYNYLTEIEELL